jgi:uncharacterized protein (DUF2141 family)
MKGFRKCSVLMVLLSLSIYFFGQTLDIQIKNIRVGKGQICVAVFANEAGFKAEKTVWETKCPKSKVVNGELRLKIRIQPGKYGLSVLDDENENGKMEYRLFGIPSEGFGFSNYYQKGIRKPAFDDFSFIVEKDEVRIITVFMKYF